MNWENKIIEYLSGNLSDFETNLLMKEVEKSKKIKNILSQYEKLEKDIDNIKDEIPSDNLKKNFDDYISKIKINETNNKFSSIFIKSFLKYAAIGLVLLSASLTLWNQLDNIENGDNYALSEVLSEMETKTDTEKIKAIYVNSKTDSNQSTKIKQVLISSLKNDESSNVRLASVETLRNYINDDLVRAALIRSLGIEEDPQVQVAIIMALSESKSDDAIIPLKEIINKEGGYKFVKDEAHVGIMNLTSL